MPAPNLKKKRIKTKSLILFFIYIKAKGNLFYDIDDIVERPLSDYSPSQVAPNNIVTNVAEISTPKIGEVKLYLNTIKDRSIRPVFV